MLQSTTGHPPFREFVLKRFALLVCTLLVAPVALILQAQSGSAVFFAEGWESGTLTGSFNSQNYGALASGSQFQAQTSIAAAGGWALRHLIPGGTPVDGIQSGTQHFGDARTGPVWPTGQGQHFYDVYVQYKFYYSPGFDFGPGHFKQFIIGTQDERRHDEACCLPWAAHYITTIVERGAVLQAEGYNKQSSSSPRFDVNPNVGGYSDTNPFRVQTGRWYVLEVRRRLNDPGVDNGVFQMWMDGALVSDYQNVRFRVPASGAFGTNFTYGTNFAILTDYSTYPVNAAQSVYYDDVKMSTSYIGSGGGATPPAAPTNLRVIR